MPEPDEEMTKEQRTAYELHEAYRRQFKQYAPAFGLPQGDILQLIRKALATGKPIRMEIPPDAEA